ncbi:uncharacterized protein SPPG_07300 [Spizellomyces punctatus DAOM BR117]|uniref:DM13 domain-containing protein n=1 Tax=Spizellomyces punctatus (strain DAOM BR117) TaxID=645134 RepID=A0A0L0H9P4_SPIPD|nr:uncharacterized protein SPPG_07300 [Spizellomyces punctatus DAOM BR117]KNC97373.1 hypothetical protein SPPG_07300 [Spizellomyces punctatus DAOM BR117]|eukprot:XP_016605413.1 hypothetical protein SPPG_07300 [Spizellomyces punctatus DAOM BR117]
MVRFTTLLLLAAATFSTISAKPCNVADTKYVGQKAVLKQVAASLPNQPAAVFQISGTAEILDGCNFIVRNFTFLPGYAGSVWLGRRPGDQMAKGVAENVVASNNLDSQKFTLRSVPGSEISFDEFDTLVLFSTIDNFEMATAQFPGLAAPNATSTGSSPSATEAASGKSKSSASSVGGSAVIVGAAAAAAAFAVGL